MVFVGSCVKETRETTGTDHPSAPVGDQSWGVTGCGHCPWVTRAEEIVRPLREETREGHDRLGKCGQRNKLR